MRGARKALKRPASIGLQETRHFQFERQACQSLNPHDLAIDGHRLERIVGELCVEIETGKQTSSGVMRPGQFRIARIDEANSGSECGGLRNEFPDEWATTSFAEKRAKSAGRDVTAVISPRGHGTSRMLSLWGRLWMALVPGVARSGMRNSPDHQSWKTLPKI